MEITFLKILLTDLHGSIYYAVPDTVSISLCNFENEIHKQVSFPSLLPTRQISS